MNNKWKRLEKPKGIGFNHLEWVEVVLHIRKNETGEVRKYIHGAIKEINEDFISPYIYEDGNYACDCNRELFFEEANGIEINLDNVICTEGMYLLNVENPATGEIFYKEF